MAQSLDSTCEHTRDELLAAQCESRTPSPDSTSHLKTCNACREAQKQLVGASPEALALLVLMRGIAPTPAPKKTFDIKSDQELVDQRVAEFDETVQAELASAEEREFAHFVYRRQQPSASLRSLSAEQIDRVHALVRRFKGVNENIEE